MLAGHAAAVRQQGSLVPEIDQAPPLWAIAPHPYLQLPPPPSLPAPTVCRPVAVGSCRDGRAAFPELGLSIAVSLLVMSPYGKFFSPIRSNHYRTSFDSVPGHLKYVTETFKLLANQGQKETAILNLTSYPAAAPQKPVTAARCLLHHDLAAARGRITPGPGIPTVLPGCPLSERAAIAAHPIQLENTLNDGRAE
eukprot:763664-Hanusia_phi.AAC.12